MKKLTYNPTDNPNTTVHGSQQRISDINTQLIELDKGMLIANTLKGRLNSQHYTNASWLVTKIKATLKITIQKFENPIFSFKITHEAAVRNRKILAALKGDLGSEIAAHKDSPVNYGLEFRDTTDLEKLFFHHKEKPKIINIIQHGSCYHIDKSKRKQ